MMRAVDLANLRKTLLAMTELEAATLAMLETIEQTRDDMRRTITDEEEEP